MNLVNPKQGQDFIEHKRNTSHTHTNRVPANTTNPPRMITIDTASKPHSSITQSKVTKSTSYANLHSRQAERTSKTQRGNEDRITPYNSYKDELRSHSRSKSRERITSYSMLQPSRSTNTLQTVQTSAKPNFIISRNQMFPQSEEEFLNQFESLHFKPSVNSNTSRNYNDPRKDQYYNFIGNASPHELGSSTYASTDRDMFLSRYGIGKATLDLNQSPERQRSAEGYSSRGGTKRNGTGMLERKKEDDSNHSEFAFESPQPSHRQRKSEVSYRTNAPSSQFLGDLTNGPRIHHTRSSTQDQNTKKFLIYQTQNVEKAYAASSFVSSKESTENHKNVDINSKSFRFPNPDLKVSQSIQSLSLKNLYDFYENDFPATQASYDSAKSREITDTKRSNPSESLNKVQQESIGVSERRHQKSDSNRIEISQFLGTGLAEIQERQEENIVSSRFDNSDIKNYNAVTDRYPRNETERPTHRPGKSQDNYSSNHVKSSSRTFVDPASKYSSTNSNATARNIPGKFEKISPNQTLKSKENNESIINKNTTEREKNKTSTQQLRTTITKKEDFSKSKVIVNKKKANNDQSLQVINISILSKYKRETSKSPGAKEKAKQPRFLNPNKINKTPSPQMAQAKPSGGDSALKIIERLEAPELSDGSELFKSREGTLKTHGKSQSISSQEITRSLTQTLEAMKKEEKIKNTSNQAGKSSLSNSSSSTLFSKLATEGHTPNNPKAQEIANPRYKNFNDEEWNYFGLPLRTDDLPVPPRENDEFDINMNLPVKENLEFKRNFDYSSMTSDTNLDESLGSSKNFMVVYASENNSKPNEMYQSEGSKAHEVEFQSAKRELKPIRSSSPFTKAFQSKEFTERAEATERPNENSLKLSLEMILRNSKKDLRTIKNERMSGSGVKFYSTAKYEFKISFVSDMKGHHNSITSLVKDFQRNVIWSSSKDHSIMINSKTWTVKDFLMNFETMAEKPFKINDDRVRIVHKNVGTIDSLCCDKGKLVFSGGSDRVIRAWNAQTCDMVHTYKGHSGGIFALSAFDDNTFLSGSGDASIKRWDISSGNCIRSWGEHTNRVQSVIRVEHNSSELIASAGSDKTIKLWDVRCAKSVGTIDAHERDITSLCTLGNSEQIASSSLDGTVKIWDVSYQREVEAVKVGSEVHTIAYYMKDNKLIVGSNNLNVISIGNDYQIETYNEGNQHKGTIRTLVIDNDLDVLYSGSFDQTIKVWLLKRNKYD